MVERPPSRRWLAMIEWMTVISFVLAVLGFLGFSNWSAIVSTIGKIFPHETPVPPPDKPLPPPQPRPPSPAPAWQEPSNVGGQSWTMRFEGRDIRLDFSGGPVNGDVAVSDSMLGGSGRWQRRDRRGVSIQTASRTIAGEMTTDGQAMSAVVYDADGRDLGHVTLRRIH
jgi:hypothetical protein